MTPCISQATTLSGSFADDVENYPSGGCTAIEVWLTKLEQHLQSVSAESTRKALADRGVALVAAAYQGGLLLSQGEARKAHFDHFKRRLDLCQYFRIPTLLVVADFVEIYSDEDYAQRLATRHLIRHPGLQTAAQRGAPVLAICASVSCSSYARRGSNSRYRSGSSATATTS